MNRGFPTYEAMLHRRPDLGDTCRFASVATVPGRPTAWHDAYRLENEAIVRRINERFSRRAGTWSRRSSREARVTRATVCSRPSA